MNREISLATHHGPLHGHLTVPLAARGLVLVARTASGEADVGHELPIRHLAVLDVPLLTSQETPFPDAAHNVPLLAERLVEILNFIRIDGDTEALPLGIFASGHGTPAALRVAALRDAQVKALACHGGLVDLAGLQNLRLLAAPLLVLADADDAAAQTAFQRAAVHLAAPHRLQHLQPGEGPGGHVAAWFGEHLPAI